VAAGRIIEDDAPNTVADGQKVSLRDRTWFFVSSHVSELLLGDRPLYPLKTACTLRRRPM
jgi:hypothetical protein